MNTIALMKLNGIKINMNSIIKSLCAGGRVTPSLSYMEAGGRQKHDNKYQQFASIQYPLAPCAAQLLCQTATSQETSLDCIKDQRHQFEVLHNTHTHTHTHWRYLSNSPLDFNSIQFHCLWIGFVPLVNHDLRLARDH